MATNYGDTIFEGELAPSVTRVDPVVDKSGEYLASGINQTINAVDSLLFSPEAKAGKADAAKNGLFAEIAEYTSYLADARDQGIGTDEIMRKFRVKSLEWVSNNPNLTEDIYTFSNKLLQDNGIGGNINKETPAETGQRKLIEAGIADGFNMSSDNDINVYKQHQLLAAQAKQLENEISLLGREGKVATAKQQNQATLVLNGLVSTGTKWANDVMSRGSAELASVQDPKARSAIIQRVKAEVAQGISVVSANRTLSGNAIDTSYLTTGITDILKVWEETANGTADLAVLETTQKTVDTKNILMLNQLNPKLSMLIAMDKSSKFQLPSMIEKMDQEMMNTYTKLFESGTVNEDGTTSPATSKPPDMVESVENVGLITDNLKASTKEALNNPEASPEELAAQANKLFNTMRSINVYGASDTDAKNFMSVVDLFSDTSVGRFLEKNPTLIDISVADQAKQILQKQYDGIVIPLINEEWQTATEMIVQNPTAKDEWNRKIGLGPQGANSSVQMDVTKMVEPTWNGAGIEFRVADAFATDPNIRNIAKKLNTDVAPAVNRMVRTFAHLSGTTDYEKIYNEQYSKNLFVPNEGDGVDFPKMEKVPEKGLTAKQIQNPSAVDNPSELDLADFSDEEFRRIVESSAAKNPEALMTATSPTEIAQAYLGMNENDSEQVKTLSAFISRNAGLDINPATTAWCAAFVDAVLGAGGGKGTGKLNARSYLAWGVPVDKPQVGDVVVLQRGSGGESDWRGHVGFYMGTNDDGTIRVLGGNQGDSVAEDSFAADKVLGFRRAG